jgi:hypothetical protein
MQTIALIVFFFFQKKKQKALFCFAEEFGPKPSAKRNQWGLGACPKKDYDQAGN